MAKQRRLTNPAEYNQYLPIDASTVRRPDGPHAGVTLARATGQELGIPDKAAAERQLPAARHHAYIASPIAAGLATGLLERRRSRFIND